MTDDRKEPRSGPGTQLKQSEIDAIALRKAENEAKIDKLKTKAMTDRRNFWLGGLFGLGGLAGFVVGLVQHDHYMMVGGFVGGLVAVKIIPLAEVVKLWPWHKGG